MSRYGVDYAYGDPSPAELKKELGPHPFVVRYTSDPGNSKNMRPDEVKRMLDGGVDVVTVYEGRDPRWMLGGWKAGVAAARLSLQEAQVCGEPHRAAHYYAGDSDFQPGRELRACLDCLAGAASVHGFQRTGVYGGIRLVSGALDAARARFGWQTFAWSYGRWDERAQLRQIAVGKHIAGVGVDLDESEAANFGQWGFIPPPVPKPRPWPGIYLAPGMGNVAVRQFFAELHRQYPHWDFGHFAVTSGYGPLKRDAVQRFVEAKKLHPHTRPAVIGPTIWNALFKG